MPIKVKLYGGREVELRRRLAPEATWERAKCPEYSVDFSGFAECTTCNGRAGQEGRLEGGLRIIHLTRDGTKYEYVRACNLCIYGAYRHATGPKFRFCLLA